MKGNMTTTMIEQIEVRRRNLVDYLNALDTVLKFERDINALQLGATVSTTVAAEAVSSAQVDNLIKRVRLASVRRNAKRQELPQIVRRGGDKAPRAVIVNAISNLPEPFSMRKVREWVMAHDPESGRRIGKSTWGTTIYALRELGWISELGEKVDNRTAYKRGRHWPAGGALKSAKEQAYQDFRATVPVPAQVEA